MVKKIICFFISVGMGLAQFQSVDIIGFNPTPVTTGSAGVTGQTGVTTYYYWIVANYPAGKAIPYFPIQITNAPNTLSSINYVVVSWQIPMQGVTSYDVLRTTTPNLPSSGGLSVVTGLSGSVNSYNDQGGALSTYTVQGTPAVVGKITVDSINYPVPRFKFSLPIVPTIYATDYIFSPIIVNQAITGGVPTTITISPVPYGVYGGNVGYWMYANVCSGGTQAIKITGGNAVGGRSSGTLTFTPTNSCNAGWQLSSGFTGVGEAMAACGGPCTVTIPSGSYTVHAPITTPYLTSGVYRGYTITGESQNNTAVTLASDFPLSASYVIGGGNDGINIRNGPTVQNLSIICPQPWGSALSTYTHWPTVFYSVMKGNVARNLYVAGAWVGFDFRNSGQHLIEYVKISAYSKSINLQDNYDTTTINKVMNWPFTDSLDTFAKQESFYDPTVTFVYASGNAGIKISDSFSISGTSLDFPGGNSFVNIVNSEFDQFGAIKFSYVAGNIVEMANIHMYQSQTTPLTTFTCSVPAINIGGYGTTLNISNLTVIRNCVAYPIVNVVSRVAFDPTFDSISIVNSNFIDTSNSTSAADMVKVDGTGSNQYLKLIGNTFQFEQNLSYTNSMLKVTGGAVGVTFIGNQNAGVGSGVAVNMNTDGQHNIDIRNISGPAGTWTATLPASKAIGTYQGLTTSCTGKIAGTILNTAGVLSVCP